MPKSALLQKKNFVMEEKVLQMILSIVCLVTEEKCDWVREKLWALSRTPYDITMYIDADCQRYNMKIFV
jgi:hypothetical protein